MVSYNLMNQSDRSLVVKMAIKHLESEIAIDANKENRIYKGLLKNYVLRELKTQFGPETVKQMPVVDTINICKRVIDKEASIYRRDPDRSFNNLKEKQLEAIGNIYSELKLKKKLIRANRVYKNSKQCFLQVLHDDKKKNLKLRILKKYQCFIIPKLDNPEEIGIFVTINSFKDSEKNKRYTFGVWTEEYNFVMDDKGNILSALEDGVIDVINPLGVIPVIDISDEDEKDGCIYNESDMNLANFTIQLNVALTDLMHIMRQQGYAVPIIKGPGSVLDELKQVQIGVNKILKLQTDIQTNVDTNAEVDFAFVSANPDLVGSIETINSLLSAFLTAKGVEANAVNFKSDAKSFTSGWERFLALIESFEASQDDMGVFQEVEKQLFDIVVAYHNAYKDDPSKLPKYMRSSFIDLSNVSITVNFAGPEITETRKETLERLNLEESSGLISRKMKLKSYNGYTDQEADEHFAKMKEDEKVLQKEDIEPENKDNEIEGDKDEDVDE